MSKNYCNDCGESWTLGEEDLGREYKCPKCGSKDIDSGKDWLVIFMGWFLVLFVAAAGVTVFNLASTNSQRCFALLMQPDLCDTLDK